MNANILVVEDEKSQREMLVEKLKDNGFSVQEAENGQIGLKKLKENKYDLLITDIQMPKMNGIEMMKIVRRNEPSLPVILITGYADLELAIEALNSGAKGLFKKPFDLDDLIPRIKRCLLDNRMSSVLLQSAKMSGLGELTASVAHELRNALAEINMAGGILQKMAELDKKQLKYLEKMLHGVYRADSIIGHLLDFSRRSEKRNLIHLDNLFNGLLSLVDDRIRLQSISIERDIGDIHVEGVVDSLNIIFLNLIQNAIQSMEDGGVLGIKVATQNSQTEIAIEDTGCGIPAEIQPDIFDTFYTTKGDKGNGLGLSLVKKEVEKLGGKIKLKSREGKGTTFTVSLPRLEREAVN